MKTTLLIIVSIATICVGPLLVLSGCAFGGARETNNIVLCEPGSVVEIATDQKIDVIAVQDDGKKAIGKKNMAGTVAMPKSVYNQLKECWAKAHAEKTPNE